MTVWERHTMYGDEVQPVLVDERGGPETSLEPIEGIHPRTKHVGGARSSRRRRIQKTRLRYRKYSLSVALETRYSS